MAEARHRVVVVVVSLMRRRRSNAAAAAAAAAAELFAVSCTLAMSDSYADDDTGARSFERLVRCQLARPTVLYCSLRLPVL